MKTTARHISIFIIKEVDFIYLLADINYDENIKNNLIKIINDNYESFCSFYYYVLKYYYKLTSESLIDKLFILDDKDKIKLEEVRKFVLDEKDLFVIDIYDYLYTMTNIYNEIDFKDELFEIMNNLLVNLKSDIDLDEIYEYIYLIKVLLNYVILNTLFSKVQIDNEENIIMGLSLNNTFKELYLVVYNNVST